MELRLFTEPYHGATYDELARAARHAEECGFEGFFVADHYHPMHYTDALPGPTDAWTTLAGLARETSRIRLGTLMTSATFRHPGPLAVTVAQVDAMSGGRVELGLGAGWFALDHSAYGIPFPPPAERFERMEEQLRIDHRPLGHAARRALLVRGPPLPSDRLARPAEAGPAAGSADHRRRPGPPPHTGPGRPVRRRVQPAVHLTRAERRAVRRARGPPGSAAAALP